MTTASTLSDSTCTDFSRLINPRAVAVVGASQDLSRIGGQPLRLLTEYGYAGKVYPINPKYPEIAGLRCYPNVSSVPQPCDVAIIALSATHVPGAIEQCGKAKVPFAIVLSSGFGEIGTDGSALQEKLTVAARASNVRVIGPNCLGILNLKDNVRHCFGGTSMMRTLIPGPTAIVTQSGGYGFGIVATAAYYGIGFNYAISTGNEADITALELVEYLIEQPELDSVTMFIEGVADGPKLLALGERALKLDKPIIVWKIGNSDVGRQAAASHTARMTSAYELFQAVFRHGAFIEVHDLDDLVDTLKMVNMRRLPRGNRVGVLSLSGGSAVLLADCCVREGLVLPPLAEETVATIRKFVPSFASVANPVDATANAYNDGFASFNRVVEAVLHDPGIDQVIVRAPRGSAATAWARGLDELATTTDKPIVVNWPTAPDDNGEVMHYLEQHRLPCIVSPGRGVRALAAINEFARRREQLASRPVRSAARSIPVQPLQFPEVAGTVGEFRSKSYLRAYGIPAVRELLFEPDDLDQLKDLALTFPVAVKIESPDVPHKTEAGAVRLNITNLDDLKLAAREVVRRACDYRSGARIEGVLVQEMASGLEVIVGAVNDSCFGPVIACGLGGVNAELVRDVTRRLAPFGVEAAREMIDELKARSLFDGYRGSPPLDIDALAQALSRVSYMVSDYRGRIVELDINPIFVRPAGKGVVAADALLVIRCG